MSTPDQLVPGAIVRTNYNTGPYTVARVTVIEGLIGIACEGGSYLNDYVWEDGRLVKARPWLPGSSGYLSNRGGLNGDGRDEVFIVEPAVLSVESVPARSGRKTKPDAGQLSLFGEGA